jgi:hypothetical protein
MIVFFSLSHPINISCFSKDRETFVEQTPRAVFTDNVSQWSIFDSYNEDFDQQVNYKFKMKNKIYLFIYFFSKKQKKKNKRKF